MMESVDLVAPPGQRGHSRQLAAQGAPSQQDQVATLAPSRLGLLASEEKQDPQEPPELLRSASLKPQRRAFAQTQ